MNSQLLLHFLRFDIRSRSLDLEPWMRRLYRSNDLTDLFPAASPRLHVEVERADAPQALAIAPMPHGVFTETLLGFGRCHYAAGRFHSVSDGDYQHEIEYDLATHTVRANVGGRYLDSAQFVVVYFIRPLLHSLLLPFHGMKSLHGAVLARATQTVFLSGAGGAGKSTAAAQLLHDGYELLADDAPFFALHHDNAVALASLDYLHFTRATVNRFPEMRRGIVGEADHKDKFAVNPDEVGRGFHTRPRRITHFVTLQRGPIATPRITPLDRNEVLRQLLAENVMVFRAPAFRAPTLPFRRHTELVFDIVQALMRDARPFRLEYADHHLTDLARLLNGLDEHPADEK